jgi:hypothetical protein
MSQIETHHKIVLIKIPPHYAALNQEMTHFYLKKNLNFE